MISLHTTTEVIKALGGLKAVADLTGRTRSAVVWNWKDRERFPANTFTVMKPALEQRGLDAPDSLWGMP